MAKTLSLSEIARNINNVNLDEEILVFDSGFIPHQQHNFPMRINALIIILCRRGKGRIEIDLKSHDIEEDTLVFIQPKNYINLMDVNADFSCHIIACSQRIVEDVLPKLTDLLPLLIHHRTEPVTRLNHNKAEELNSYYNFLKGELAKPRSLFTKNKVECLLQAALFELMEIQHSSTDVVVFQKTRKEEIMAEFLISVSEHFREERQVSYYAKKLCISPKHLSSVVKEISGRTAGEWIENYVIMEAKVLLRTTDYTIQYVAQHLNFTNQSFFGKYFKQVTGKSPSAYRREEA